MLLRSKKAIAIAQRTADRREREERAPRLLAAIPALQALRIAIEDRYALGVTKHVRHVMVARAPALFVIPCGDAVCDSEGHDITSEIMHGLSTRSPVLESESRCYGSVGSAPCTRVLQFKLHAEYAAV